MSEQQLTQRHEPKKRDARPSEAEGGRLTGPTRTGVGPQSTPRAGHTRCDTDAAWVCGDRVQVELPDHLGLYGRKHADHWFKGTVRDVDERGVTVDLDVIVNGVRDCHATHTELRRA